MNKTLKVAAWILMTLLIIHGGVAAEASKQSAINLGNELEFPALADMETGLVFPLKLAEFIFLYHHQYDDPELGYSVRYKKDEWNKVDIYVYNLGYAEIPDGPDSETVKKESRSIARIVRSMQENNSYADVKTEEKTLTPIGGKTSFIKQSYRYTELQNSSEEGSVKRCSESYITGYKNHFVKIRFTYDSNKGISAQKAIRDLVEGLIGLMETNHDEKVMSLAAAKIFQADPTSDEARFSMQGALNYIIETDDFTISIPSEIFPWSDQDQNIENAELLFAGYLAGVISYIIPNGLDKGGEAEGFSVMLKIYRTLRDENAIRKIDKLDVWLLEEDKENLFYRITGKSKFSRDVHMK